jgi:hypothetical protein
MRISRLKFLLNILSRPEAEAESTAGLRQKSFTSEKPERTFSNNVHLSDHPLQQFGQPTDTSRTSRQANFPSTL